MKNKYDSAVLEKTTIVIFIYIKFQEKSIKIKEQEQQRIDTKNKMIEKSEDSKNVNLRNEHAHLKINHRAQFAEMVCLLSIYKYRKSLEKKKMKRSKDTIN